MKDKQFLWWIHERLVNVHGEKEMVDYMHHLRRIIFDMSDKKETSNISRTDTDACQMRKKLG